MSASAAAADPWAQSSIQSLGWRSGPYVHRFAKHLTRQPYRSGLTSSSLRRWGRASVRIRCAAYDAVIDLLLDGYTSITGIELRAETGQLVLRLTRLLAAFDDRYEHRLAGGDSLEFGEILADDLVQDRLRPLADFLSGRPEGQAVREFLTSRVDRHYQRYVSLTTMDSALVDLDQQLELATLDSAGFMVCFVHAIALFHGGQPSEEVVRQFSSIGLIAKLADDSIDFWDDLAAGRANLLRGIVHQHPSEEATVIDVAARHHGDRAAPAGINWWSSNCPRSFRQFTALVAEHRARVTAPQLRLACDLMLVPVRRGRTIIQSAPQGLRI